MNNNSTPTILFISPQAYGHLIKTVKIARFFEKKGANIHYLIQGNNSYFFDENKFAFNSLESSAFGYNTKKIKDKNKIKAWWHELKERNFSTRFKARKEEIESYLSILNPTHIFIDIFCISDFLFCYQFAKKTNAKIIGITPFYPEIANSKIPPLNYYAFPGKDTPTIWAEKISKNKSRKIKQRLRFPFRSDTALINKALKKLSIPKCHTPIYLERFPIFQEIDFWYLQPKELDFEGQVLPNKHHYMGPLIDTDIVEEQNTRIDFFMKLKSKNASNKLIFCSLGSVISQLISNEEIESFFNKIIEIGKNNPTWFIAIKAPKNLVKQLKPKSLNVMIFDHLPYQQLMSLADVFISHGGGNSYLEAIYGKTPLLIVPPIDYWDYNGVAARCVNKKIAIKQDFNTSSNVISESISLLINDDSYKNEIIKLNEEINKLYPKNYLDQYITF
jgi:UDP:flavonoid glycosyltransferase YjiC (YdhE family)